MAVAPTLGLALIAKDEEATLPHLLASIEGAFDQVAMVDTGSTDRTVEVFAKWAERQNLPMGYKLDHFEWCDDFAAARNAADDLLDTDWLMYLDADDTIIGGERIRQALSVVPDHILGIQIPYEYTHDSEGNCICTVPFLRIVRRCVGPWYGRVEERKWVHPDRIGVAHPPFVRVIHSASEAEIRQSRIRDAELLNQWLQDEPDDPLPLALAVHKAFNSFQRKHIGQYMGRYLAAVSREVDRVLAGEREPEMLERIADSSQWLQESVTVALTDWAAQDKASFLEVMRDEMQGKMPLPEGHDEPVAPFPLQDLESAGADESGQPSVRKTRQQRRAEARAKAKELARAA